MLIAVDEDIPFAAQAFARFGSVRALPARQLNAAALRDVDALIVRSVTRVDAKLLDGTCVRFAGTATSGVDHIDLPYLRHSGIAFADARGANANAVAEYVAAALLHLRGRCGLNLGRASLGIVGFGHAGRRVARYAAALGLRIVVNDPPLGRSTCEPIYRPLEDILACDVITLHVPLERGGSDPTFHLVDDTFLDGIKLGSFLINTSRGAVADSGALKRALDRGTLGGLIADVWENEPHIDVDLARRCSLSTAHIAGHTLDAKIAAVIALTIALGAHLGLPSAWAGPDDSDAGPIVCGSLAHAVQQSFDIAKADTRLRETFTLSGADRAAAFDALRAGWPSRREFHVHPIILETGGDADINTLHALGFLSAAVAGSASR